MGIHNQERELGVKLGLSLILGLSIVSLGITIAGIILHPLNIGSIWDIMLCLINLTTSVCCIFGLVGRDKDIALFIDRLFRLNILVDKKENKCVNF